jgi:hypothetical protein
MQRGEYSCSPDFARYVRWFRATCIALPHATITGS